MSTIKAKKLAKEIYEGRTRLSGESYYEHAEDLVKRLQKYGLKEEGALVTAWLHHALDEDAKKNEEKIKRILGEEAIDLIKRYTKITASNVKTETLWEKNEKYLIQLFVNLGKDIRLIIVRTVDKLHDLENSWVFGKEKREELALRALYLYAPLAKILGVTKISRDLEDAAFKILYPEEFFALENIVKKRSWGTKKLFGEVQKFISEILEEQGIENFKVQYRTKGLYSLHKKIARYQENGKYVGENLEGIFDLFAIRIVVNTVEECYLTETLIRQIWDDLPSERDDYIKNPRSTGYRSIHNAVKIEDDFIAEIQIRTHEMHRQAEFGMSSHLLYKIGDKGEKSQAVEEFKKYLKAQPEWFRSINYWEIDKKKGFVPQTPFSDKVYAFTPKGDIIELPRGATVVDFAYAVHTEIGDKCVGAFINNKIVKLDQEVRTGDTVKIKVDGRKKGPSKDWLRSVKTKRAKIQINKAWRD